MTRTMVVLLAILLLTGCAKFDNSAQQGYAENYVRRYVDAEAGVVCWLFDSAYRGGIACMPLADTNLSK